MYSTLRRFLTSCPIKVWILNDDLMTHNNILGLRQERPPHLRSGHIHPAMIERGRAIQNAPSVPIIMDKPHRAPDAPVIVEGRVSVFYFKNRLLNFLIIYTSLQIRVAGGDLQRATKQVRDAKYRYAFSFPFDYGFGRCFSSYSMHARVCIYRWQPNLTLCQ